MKLYEVMEMSAAAEFGRRHHRGVLLWRYARRALPAVLAIAAGSFVAWTVWRLAARLWPLMAVVLLLAVLVTAAYGARQYLGLGYAPRPGLRAAMLFVGMLLTGSVLVTAVAGYIA